MENIIKRMTFASQIPFIQYQDLCENFAGNSTKEIIEDYYLDTENFLLYKKKMTLELRKYCNNLDDHSKFKLSLLIGGGENIEQFIHSPIFPNDRNKLFADSEIPEGILKNKLKEIINTQNVSFIGKVNTKREMIVTNDYIVKLDNNFFSPTNTENYILKVEARKGLEKEALSYFSKIIDNFKISYLKPVNNYRMLVQCQRKAS